MLCTKESCSDRVLTSDSAIPPLLVRGSHQRIEIEIQKRLTATKEVENLGYVVEPATPKGNESEVDARKRSLLTIQRQNLAIVATNCLGSTEWFKIGWLKSCFKYEELHDTTIKMVLIAASSQSSTRWNQPSERSGLSLCGCFLRQSRVRTVRAARESPFTSG